MCAYTTNQMKNSKNNNFGNPIQFFLGFFDESLKEHNLF